MKIEPYQKKYRAAVISLILEIQTNEFQIPIDIHSQPDLLEIERFYQIKNGNFWVAVIGHTVVGTIALLDIGERKSALRKMFVHKNYRGKLFGVSQQLMNTAIHWARAKEMSQIYLGTTEKFIAAQKFYSKNNFSEIKPTDLPISFPIMAVDVKFYCYHLV